MQTQEVDFSGRLPIEGYGPGFFRLAGVVHEGPLLLLPSGPRPWAGFADLSSITEAAASIDVLLVGLGAEFALMPPDARKQLEDAGLLVEAMATPSACRSYNVLLAEGRHVAAALHPV